MRLELSRQQLFLSMVIILTMVVCVVLWSCDVRQRRAARTSETLPPDSRQRSADGRGDGVDYALEFDRNVIPAKPQRTGIPGTIQPRPTTGTTGNSSVEDIRI